jgi:hypothetical protein
VIILSVGVATDQVDEVTASLSSLQGAFTVELNRLEAGLKKSNAVETVARKRLVSTLKPVK